MAEINLTEEIMKHSDEEIIDYLARTISSMRRTYTKAGTTGTPGLLYGRSGDIAAVYPVIIAMDRRNQKCSIKESHKLKIGYFSG